MDGLFDKFDSLIENDPRKAHIYLASMFGDSLGIGISSKHYGMFAKLIKMYGYKRVMFAILDVYDMDPSAIDNPYPLLVYFIKKKLKVNNTTIDDLSGFVNSLRAEVGSRKLKVRRDLDSE